MKILYLGNFSESWRTETWVLKALKYWGVDVKKVQEDGKPIIPELKEFKPEYFLYSKARKTPDFEKALKYCRDNNIISVCWLYDLYWGTPREGEARCHPRFSADLVLDTDDGHNKMWEKFGVNHRVLRQGIFKEDAKKVQPDKDKYPEDILFVGHKVSWFPYRQKVMKFLKKTYGDKFAWRGRNNELREKELSKAIASAKVIIGDSVYSPKYWSNRIYETLGRGGFFIHCNVAHLEREFEYYKHLIPYDPGNFEQLKEIIDYYLSHDKDREKIAMAGQEYCLENYTYRIRVKQLIKEMKNCRKRHEENPKKYKELREKRLTANDKVKENPEVETNDIEETKLNSVPKITVILLNYERPQNVRDLIKQLKEQEKVDLDIWLWDSQPARNEKYDKFKDCKVFRDEVNPGIFIRWELARMASTEYVLFCDDDIIIKDELVVRDIWERSLIEPDNVIVGWRGVRQLVKGQSYPDSFHTWSKMSKEDQRVHIIKGQIFMINRGQLERSRSFPVEITQKIDSRTHGEIFYGLLWGNNKPIHLVMKDLTNRIENKENKARIGLEYRKDHYFKQKKHWDYVYSREYEKNK